jgi:glycosyltransferase involved in cell wall biosynthesis
MRILQVSSAKAIGGGERHLIDLTRGLITSGHEIFLAAAPASPIFERIPELNRENILEIKIKNSLDVLAARRLAGFIRKHKIEIIHAHLGKDYLPASLAARFAPEAKFVLSRHVLFPVKALHKFALKNAAKAIAVSAPVEANLEKIFPKEKIALIPYGIEVENWSENDKEQLWREFRFEHNISFEALLIGTLGELKVLKGQRDFVLAAKILAEKFPDAYFLSSGKDNSLKKEFRSELKRLVKVFNLEDRFLFLDWVEDSAPMLAALDVFVSASHTESFGLAILEAMASGTAVVATETGGAKQLIEDGITGKLVPIKEPVRLAEAIGEILDDENLCRTLGKNAQAIAKEKFGLERMVKETERLYMEL